jgi:hypothetical protein
VGFRPGLEAEEKGIFSFLYRESNPNSSVVQPKD